MIYFIDSNYLERIKKYNVIHLFRKLILLLL